MQLQQKLQLVMAIASLLQAVGWIGLACVCASWLLSKKKRPSCGTAKVPAEQPQLVPMEGFVSAQEVQVDAFDALPIIDGMTFPSISWYKVTPDKVTICCSDGNIGHAKCIKEYPAKMVALSGHPANRR